MCGHLSIYLFTLCVSLYLHDLHQRETRVFKIKKKPIGFSKYWRGVDWAFPSFLFVFSVYATLSLYLNTYEWLSPNRESSIDSPKTISPPTKQKHWRYKERMRKESFQFGTTPLSRLDSFCVIHCCLAHHFIYIRDVGTDHIGEQW